MKYIIMFVMHFFKVAHYWLTTVTSPELHPEISYPDLAKLFASPFEAMPDFITEYIPAVTEAVFWQTAKLAEIYLSVIF